ncbi:unnamed protein product [Calypogeia fissa]
MMAFTSKVVILLLFSSLAWWQASALGRSAEIVTQGLNNIETVTRSLYAEGKGISKSNFEVKGPQVVDGIKNITKACFRASLSVQKVKNDSVDSFRLSDSDTAAVLQALRGAGFAQLLLSALFTDLKYRQYLVRYRPSVEEALITRRSSLDSYFSILISLIPKESEQAFRKIFKTVRNAEDLAISKYKYRA